MGKDLRFWLRLRFNYFKTSKHFIHQFCKLFVFDEQKRKQKEIELPDKEQIYNQIKTLPQRKTNIVNSKYVWEIFRWKRKLAVLFWDEPTAIRTLLQCQPVQSYWETAYEVVRLEHISHNSISHLRSTNKHLLHLMYQKNKKR